MNTLSPDYLADETRKFHELINVYPCFTVFWDKQKMDLNVNKLNASITTMSHGERIMAQFFVSLWLGSNDNRFDILDAAAVLDKNERIVIAKWLTDPFWP
ncbi:hypothetical protein [Yersinia intermedia]|uniref:hypothetical protein n=1 Tax=Yersinia intermedia TaxID=631 RepID=UPI000B6B55D1|nr:hypothetical protein [Yersinia intermedia]MCW8114224.1 hypothetical protein [Yersinia intermedia]MDA5518993.1 hypothetical protein [Yersinia intermedia]OWF87360.1 hypothetical protein B4916_21595 [Yersinia intermedia]